MVKGGIVGFQGFLPLDNFHIAGIVDAVPEIGIGMVGGDGNRSLVGILVFGIFDVGRHIGEAAGIVDVLGT